MLDDDDDDGDADGFRLCMVFNPSLFPLENPSVANSH
jgi:hypothetical protein